MVMSKPADTDEWLNYLHLRRFWWIARERNLTRAAERLNVSQSTLSEQLRELEEWLGQPLFERRQRQLHLTEAGRLAFDHAEAIFQTGQELLDQFRRRQASRRQHLRIGAVGPLSKNLQFDFIQPLLDRRNLQLTVASGSLAELLQQLREHQLDLVLSNIPVRADQEANAFNHLLGEMPAYLTGNLAVDRRGREFPEWLEGVPLFLPSRQSQVRADFDALLVESGVEPDIRAEVDDMALLRLLALSEQGLALVPAIVVKHELQSRRLTQVYRVPGLAERFYAITLRRRFGTGWLEEVVSTFRKSLTAYAAPLNPAGRKRQMAIKPQMQRSTESRTR